MSDNFIQLTLGELFQEGFSIKKFKSQKDIFEFLLSEKPGNFSINEDSVIDTESNLKYKVITNIMNQIGLDISVFELKQHFIDSKLVDFRNGIAHGEKRTGKDLEDIYIEIEKELLGMIETFQTLIRNAVLTKSYLKTSVSS